MSTRYIDSPGSLGRRLGEETSHNIHPLNLKHKRKQSNVFHCVTIEGVNPFQSRSPSPSPQLSWQHTDEYSPLIEPIPSKSSLEVQITKQFKMFDDDEDSDLGMTHECVIHDRHNIVNALQEKLKQMDTQYFELNIKYNDALKENETLRNERKESDRLWMKQLEVLMDDNYQLNHTIDTMAKATNNDEQTGSESGSWTTETSVSTNLSIIIHDDVDDEYPSEDTDNYGDRSVASTSSSLSEIFSDVFPESYAFYPQISADDTDEKDVNQDAMCGSVLELDIGKDESYQLLNECRSVFVNTNQLASKRTQRLIESCTRSIVSFYEIKHIFVNFVLKYEQILERFNEILATRHSPNYHQYDAIYKLLLKNVIATRFDAQSVSKMYDKPLVTRSRHMEELERAMYMMGKDPYSPFTDA
eukprot:162652_1